MAMITMREAISQALWEEMELDERVFIMGEEVGEYDGAYKVSKGLLEKFGELALRTALLWQVYVLLQSL